MAIDNGNGVTGPFGNASFYVRKKKKIIRAKPEHYSDANSPAQQFQRTKLKLTSRFVNSLKSTIKTGYQATDEDRYDNYSNEIRQNILKTCFVNVDDQPVLLYEKIKISRGDIKAPEDCTMQIAEIPDSKGMKMATITWKKPEESDVENKSDKVVIATFSDIGIYGESATHSNLAERKDGTVMIPITRSNAPVNIWMFFQNNDAATGESKLKISDSVYLGEVGPDNP